MSDSGLPSGSVDPTRSGPGAPPGLVPSVGRRRLIQLGASGLPAALTLVSRPVRAWDCNSTSAWGSAQINPNASTTARNLSQERLDECWSISEWVNNTAHRGLGQPWTRLNLTTQPAIAAYTVATLYAATGGIPTGLTGTDKVLDKLKNGTTFQKYMLTARLNANLVANVQACLKSKTDQLVLMAGGTFSPPNLPNVMWGQPEIISYLSNNYIAVP